MAEDTAPHDDAERGPQDDGNDSSDQAPDPARKRRIAIIAAVVFLILVVAIVAYWLIAKRGRESTDDAFTDGRVIAMATRVSGYVATLNVADNQFVRAGDVLLTLAPAEYQAKADEARASVAQAEAQLAQAQPDFVVRASDIQAKLANAQQQVAQARVAYQRAHADAERLRTVDSRATSPSQIDQATEGERSARAQLEAAEAQLQTAQLTPQSTAAEAARVELAQAQLASAQAQLKEAEINVGYTQLRAPQDGYVTRRSVEVGSHVQVAQTLLSLVSREMWVVANFKENQLTDMRAGQPVTIIVDSFPDLELHGHVDSIQRGTGSRFSAFPAENATGNFVKIVQRVPVKIVLDGPLDPNLPLPIGASVVPTVDMR